MKMDDSALGTAITRKFESTEPGLPCPSLLDVAALADGNLDGAERDRLMGHLADCGECRRLFTLTRELAAAEIGVVKRRGFAIPSALAAAAVLIVAVTMNLRHAPPQVVRTATTADPAVPPVAVRREAALRLPPASPDAVAAAGKEAPPPKALLAAGKKEPLPTVDRLARMLVRTGDPRRLALLTGDGDKTHGFAGKVGDDKCLVFHIGVKSVDLEVALLADDGERAQAQAVRLGSLLRALTDDDHSAELERLIDRLEQGDKPSGLAGANAEITRPIPRDKVAFARLGAWAEGARLAAGTGNGEYFAGGVPSYFGRSFDRAGLPPEAAAALRELERKVKDPRDIRFGPVEKDIEALFGAF